ncbi:MAG: hypothetical protein PHW10_02150 [Candidatus Peribacteraceae bacterium]|nr:hypothetical protein [Candidatus Peribacteraceae bacterium]
MDVFLVLVVKLIPLYALIALGWFAGVVLKVHRDSIAFLLIYILTPIVILDGMLSVQLSAATLSLPFFFWALCTVICIASFICAKFFWINETRNLAAFASANGNTGYFGIPVAIALFGTGALGPLVLGSLGFILYENTVGFFVLSRGTFTIRESLRKVVRLPAMYALFFGLFLRLAHVAPSAAVFDTIASVRGAYGVLGMMVIGLGLAGMRRDAFDLRLVGFTHAVKFILWPLLVVGLLRLDARFFHFYDPALHPVMLLLSMVPLAVNTVAFSVIARVQPQKASLIVLTSTIVALIVIPAYTVLFF